jgi:hypothetical protein
MVYENGVIWWFSGMWDGDQFGGFPGSGEIFQHMAKVRLGRKCCSIRAKIQSLPGADLVLRDSIRR